MNEDIKQALLNAASLLTKAASNLEYGHNLEKEASAAAEAIVSRGMATTDEREFYKEYLAEHPDKIASIKNAFSDLPPINKGLGEATTINSQNAKSEYDEFDLAVLG